MPKPNLNGHGFLEGRRVLEMLAAELTLALTLALTLPLTLSRRVLEMLAAEACAQRGAFGGWEAYWEAALRPPLYRMLADVFRVLARS